MARRTADGSKSQRAPDRDRAENGRPSIRASGGLAAGFRSQPAALGKSRSSLTGESPYSGGVNLESTNSFTGSSLGSLADGKETLDPGEKTNVEKPLYLHLPLQ